MSSPPPPPQDRRIEHILLQTVPWESRKKGGSVLQDCLRDLWEKAVSISFNSGEENLARAREEAFREGKQAGFEEGVKSYQVESERPRAEALVAVVHDEELSPQEFEVIGTLCRAVETEKDISWMGTTGFADAIDELWKTAYHIGYTHGPGGAVSSAALEPPTVNIEKELEQERVWGFDVGWKLCSQLHASQASLILAPHPSPPSLSVAATQTDTVAVTPAPLDWAEDAATLPIHLSHSETPPSAPRDFSALHTGSPQPFASLQRRRRRSPQPATEPLQNPPLSRSIRRPQKKSGMHHSLRQRTPPSSSHSALSIPFPTPTSFLPPDKPNTSFPLDWDQDPRLRDLAQALAALGWVRS
ncbi:hypothetical protein C8R43DRAFT_1126892 [Mycena crocata]|nr:hypothetical protein C8R43DRAFT_1126892 [Mycena crocata]